jgi:hypothetical protein
MLNAVIKILPPTATMKQILSVSKRFSITYYDGSLPAYYTPLPPKNYLFRHMVMNFWKAVFLLLSDTSEIPRGWVNSMFINHLL